MRILFLLLCLTTFLSAAVSPMQLVIKTTSDNESFTLGLIPGETYNATVDWGDTNSDPITTDTNPSHIYATAGDYTITITGTDTSSFPGVRFNGVNPTKVYQLKQWGNHTWTTMQDAFNGCSNLTITATDEATAATGSVTDFTSAFKSCTSLTSFPLINTSSGTTFDETWHGCTNLTAFPLINTGAGTSFYRTWRNCSSLTSFPLIDTSSTTSFSSTWANCVGLVSFPLINTSKVTSFYDAWDGCTGLVSFPLIDTSAATDLDSAWYNCNSLTSFPLINTSKVTYFGDAWGDCAALLSFPLINTSQATSLYYTWAGCNSLTKFPLINTSKVTDFESAWYDCWSLTAFPLIDTSTGTNFERTWQSCSSLTSFPAINTSSGTNFFYTWSGCIFIENFPQLTLNAMTNGAGCFFGVTLPTATYNAMLIDMAANNPNNGVNFHGGKSRYNGAAITARNDTLVSTKFWNITDGGLATPIITSSIAANGQVGVSFSYQITASDSPTSFNATGLPTGLSIDTATGIISGIPSGTGVTSITLTATNGDGTGPGKTLTLSVSGAGAPIITSANAATAVANQAFSYQIVATNTPTSYAATGLPANGLSINTSTGEISGTPALIGSLEIVLQATNAMGTGVKQLTITTVQVAGSGGGSGGTPSSNGGSSCGVGGGLATFVLFSFGLMLIRLRSKIQN